MPVASEGFYPLVTGILSLGFDIPNVFFLVGQQKRQNFKHTGSGMAIKKFGQEDLNTSSMKKTIRIL